MSGRDTLKLQAWVREYERGDADKGCTAPYAQIKQRKTNGEDSGAESNARGSFYLVHVQSFSLR
jgi:hypothetical protein